MKRFAALFCVLLLTLLSVPLCAFAAQDGGMRITTVSAELPDIEIYVSGTSADAVQEAKATLNGESLRYDSAQDYQSDTISTRIYAMIDISGSVTAPVLKEAVACLKQLKSSLSDKQSLVAYTFCQTMQQVLTGDEDAAAAGKKLDAIQLSYDYTALYDALYVVHDTAVAEKGDWDHQFVIIFTDGDNEDDLAKRNATETKNLYRNLDLPIYAMCVGDASDAGKQAIGDIARVSGGTNYVYRQGHAAASFKQLQDEAFGGTILHFTKNNNKAADRDSNLSVSINGTPLTPVTVYESAVTVKSDDAAPTYTATYDHAEKCLTVVFSEPVLNAGTAENYVLTDAKGNSVKVDSVKYDADTRTAKLYFADRVYTGDYTLALSGITDNSAQENAAKDAVSLSIEGDSGVYRLLKYAYLLLIPFFIAIIVLLVLLVVKRRRKVTNVKELFEVENEHNYEVRHHIVNPAQGNEVQLEIQTGNFNNTIKTRIASSLIFGRSETCDICIDDVKLSRQHFAMEKTPYGQIEVFDLNSTNGTMINGRPLQGRVPVANGDCITAGQTSVRIRF